MSTNITVSIIYNQKLVEVDVKITSFGCPAQLYGPPENCYPAEGPEFDIDGAVEVDEQRVLTETELEGLYNLDALFEEVCKGVDELRYSEGED